MTVAEQLEAKGMKIGMKKGREETMNKVASNPFKMGMSLDVVTKATGLPIGDLEQLRTRLPEVHGHSTGKKSRYRLTAPKSRLGGLNRDRYRDRHRVGL